MTTKSRNRDVTTLKQMATGRWLEILASLGGISVELLDGRHHPCPKCGGVNRFRLIDVEVGALFCNQCFAEKNGDGLAAMQWLTGQTFPETVDLLAEYLDAKPTEQGHALDWDSIIGAGNGETTANGKPKIVATYDYCDETSNLLSQVVRLDPKGFRQRRPKPDGGWAWSTKGVRQVPYRLPELLANPKRFVFPCEGEKDCDNLAGINLLATCNAGGAGKWTAEHAQYLRGRRVFILPDNDEPGRKHAQQVAESLQGIAASVRIVELPGLPAKGDVSDWLAAGGTREKLVELAEATPEWTPSAEPEPARIADAAKRIRLPDIQDASDFCAEDIPQPAEVVQGVLHHGSKLSLGNASKGHKTWTLMDAALSVAYGIPWLGCETAQSKVLYVNLEIQRSFAQRRFKTLADAKGVIQEAGRLDVWNLRGHAASHREIFPRILDRIADGNYGFIIVDPVYKLYADDDDENSARAMAALMNSIEHLAVETGAAVAFAAHYSKGNQANKEAIDRVSGSGVFARDPDSLLNFTRHQTEDCYSVEATLRNFPPMMPFAVRWQFPLFVRDASLDPAELKTPGKSKADKIVDAECREAEHCTGC